jgi:hypothetical protein
VSSHSRPDARKCLQARSIRQSVGPERTRFGRTQSARVQLRVLIAGGNGNPEQRRRRACFPRIAGSSSTASQSPSQRESKNRRGWPHAASTRRALAQAIHISGRSRQV